MTVKCYHDNRAPLVPQILHQLRRGQISASELCERCLTRARKLRELNILVTTTTDAAQSLAEETDARMAKGDTGCSFALCQVSSYHMN